MKHKNVKLITVLLLSIGMSGLQAQEAIPASGGDALGRGGSLSYSVGQVVYVTNTGPSGSVAQGVQQPNKTLVITGIVETDGNRLEFLVYPNPSTNFIKLKVEDFKPDNFSYQLYDSHGSLLQNKEIVGVETVIQTEYLTPAAYFLRIIDNNKEEKTFTIIKN
jgi:hypothetical protein